MIKNVVLDIGNVLGTFRWRELMEDLHFSSEATEVLTKNMIMSPYWSELDRGVMTTEAVIEEFKKSCPDYTREIDVFFDNAEYLVQEYDYAQSLVKNFKEQGYGVYLLSNYPTFIFEIHKRTQFTFLPYVDGKVVSGYVHMVKPNHDIYEYLLATYDLKAEECVFFDDKPENIQAAIEIGMKGIVFHSYEQAISDFLEL